MLKVGSGGAGAGSALSWERHAKVKALFQTLGPPTCVERDGESESEGETEDETDVGTKPLGERWAKRQGGNKPPPPSVLGLSNLKSACLNPGQQRKSSTHKQTTSCSRNVSGTSSHGVPSEQRSINAELRPTSLNYPGQLGSVPVDRADCRVHVSDGATTSSGKENRSPPLPISTLQPPHATAFRPPVSPFDTQVKFHQRLTPLHNPPSGKTVLSSTPAYLPPQPCSRHAMDTGGLSVGAHTTPASIYRNPDQDDSRVLGTETETSSTRVQGLTPASTFPESCTPNTSGSHAAYSQRLDHERCKPFARAPVQNHDGHLQSHSQRLTQEKPHDDSQRNPTASLSVPGSTPIQPSSTSKKVPVGKPPLDPSSHRRPAPKIATVAAAPSLQPEPLQLSPEEREHEVVVMRSHGRVRRLKKLALIGRGGSSKVYKVISEDFDVYALKEVYLKHVDQAITQAYINEINLLNRLRDKAEIITLCDYSFDKQEGILYLLLEYAEMDLNAVIRNWTHNRMAAAVYFWNEMLQVVKVIHTEGIIHNDLKPENFVCIGARLRLIDFGIANRIESEKTSIERDIRCGTINYMAPETIEMHEDNGFFKVGRPSDVWSLGCILYLMVYGRTPFEHFRNRLKKWHAITDPSVDVAFPNVGNRAVVDVMKICLQRNAKERPTIDQLIAHPFSCCNSCHRDH